MTGRTTDGHTAGGGTGTRHSRAVASGERRGGGRDAAGREGAGGPSPGGGGLGELPEFKHAGGRCDRRLGSLQVTRRVAR